MDDPADVRDDGTGVSHGGDKGGWERRFRGLVVFLAALSHAYALPSSHLFSYAAHNDLYSHVFLIPAVVAYLVAGRLRERKPSLAPHWKPALAFASIGGVLLGACLWGGSAGWQMPIVDQLALKIGSYLAFTTAGLLLFLGVTFLRAILFPWCLLLFLVPFPAVIENGIEVFFQRTSADVAQLLMS